MIFPERYGGDDLNVMDLAVVYEEIGRALFPSPHLSSVVLSGLTLLDGGSETQKEQYLTSIASGESIFSLAVTEPDYGWDAKFISTEARKQGSGYSINGTKLYVPYAHVADYLIAAVKTADVVPEESISLFVIDKGRSGLSSSLLAGSIGEPLCEVQLEGIEVLEADLIGKLDKGWYNLRRAIDTATVLLCAETIGGVEYLLEIALRYANERVQFGQFIGTYQRIQDRIINIVNALDKARWSTYEAAWRLAEGQDCKLEISMAKVLANRAYSTAEHEAAHVFAGPGFSREFDLWLYHKKAWTINQYMGGTSHHRDIVARELLDTN